MRALRRGIAWLILAGFLSAQGAVWVAAVHAGLEDDAACAALDGPVLVGPHHQAGRQFEETNLPNPIEHCALCHMERAVGGARLARAVVSGPIERPARNSVEQVVAASLVDAPVTALRGPPAKHS